MQNIVNCLLLRDQSRKQRWPTIRPFIPFQHERLAYVCAKRLSQDIQLIEALSHSDHEAIRERRMQAEKAACTAVLR